LHETPRAGSVNASSRQVTPGRRADLEKFIALSPIAARPYFNTTAASHAKKLCPASVIC
jgi:hypothetical protein